MILQSTEPIYIDESKIVIAELIVIGATKLEKFYLHAVLDNGSEFNFEYNNKGKLKEDIKKIGGGENA